MCKRNNLCPLSAKSGRRHSFGHLVRARLQCRRHGEAEGLGGLQIDVELDLRRLLHRQVGGFRAFEIADFKQPLGRPRYWPR
jgi:hypothetical protein